jgi:hypothetical protein
MARRRSAKIPSGSRSIDTRKALSPQGEIHEFGRLLEGIREDLSRLSETYGEPMSFQIQQPYARSRLYRSPARVEAEALFHMVQAGRDSVDNVRALIAVPAKLEAYVRDYPFPNSGEQKKLLASLKFRKKVLEEFESLVLGNRMEAVVAAGAGSGNP